MKNPNNGENDKVHDSEFKRFAAKRIIVITLIMVVAIWVAGAILGYFEKSGEVQVAQKSESHFSRESTLNSRQPETLNKDDKKEPSHPLTEEKGHETTAGHPEYDKDTAGGIMTTDFIALDKDLTAKESIEYLKNTHHKIKQPDQLFVVDKNQTLLGNITTNQLLFASPETQLKDFMNTGIPSVHTGIDTKMVKSLIDRRGLSSVPVIDKANKLVGVVKADQVIHLAKQDIVKPPSRVPAPAHEVPESVQKETESTPAPHGKTTAEPHKKPVHKAPEAEETKPRAKGVAFVEATIAPLNYELNERFWGWRPNDILNVTDNVNNLQLGVLEVTRRTVVALTERLSRTGVTAILDVNLENAMNWLMIKPRDYWFPSPESKYNASLNELRTYVKRLEKGEANFYTRTDNLIPLLMALEDLLGSCEENLVKTHEDDGSSLSFFKADDYFFYAKGVVSAMETILEGVMEDFMVVLESRRGTEVLHHAIESCHHAAEIDPLLITNSSLGGILANHRANLAAPLSHARFYLGVLIKTLST